MKMPLRNFAGFLLLPFIFSACANTKNATYFKDLKDTSKIYTQIIKGDYEAHIQPDDVIEILVNSINPQATAIFNLGNNTPVESGAAKLNTDAIITSNTHNSGTYGYLVSKGGVIDFPVLGKIKVDGLTISQLKDSLASRLTIYLKNPIVNARLVNYKITVLGEVTRPSSYTLQSERISIIDAIGMAGDLTIFGKRENVLLVREENGIRHFIRLNLNSSKIFESPYFFLKQNDVVYVEPNPEKIASTDTRTVRNLTVLTSVVTLLVVVLTRIN